MTSSSIRYYRNLIEPEWIRYQLGYYKPTDLPDIGLRLLEEVPDGQIFAELASLPNGVRRPVAEDAFDDLGRELGLPFAGDPARQDEFGLVILRQLANGAISAAAAAEFLLSLENSIETAPYLKEPHLLEATGIASLWDEYPDQQVELSTQLHEIARSVIEGR